MTTSRVRGGWAHARTQLLPPPLLPTVTQGMFLQLKAHIYGPDPMAPQHRSDLWVVGYSPGLR